MKKIISLMLVLMLCLSLCACGKSEAVKNTEAMIDALGEITPESIDAIRSAENAYAALTPEEQKKVGNYEILTAARDRYYELILAGDWCSPYVWVYDISENYTQLNLILNPDMTATEYSDGDLAFPARWSVSNSRLLITDDEQYRTDYDVVEKDGIILLQSPNSNWSLMRVEDFHAYLNDIFLTVDISAVDPNEYFGLYIYEHQFTDEWGEPSGLTGTHVLPTNLLYDQGWMYFCTSEDFALEVLHPEYQMHYTSRNTDGSEHTWSDHVEAGSKTFTLWPFASREFGIGWGEPAIAWRGDLTADQLSFGRARGTITYINRDYVAEVRRSESGEDRILVVTLNGDTIEYYAGSWFGSTEY